MIHYDQHPLRPYRKTGTGFVVDLFLTENKKLGPHQHGLPARSVDVAP